MWNEEKLAAKTAAMKARRDTKQRTKELSYRRKLYHRHREEERKAKRTALEAQWAQKRSEKEQRKADQQAKIAAKLEESLRREAERAAKRIPAGIRHYQEGFSDGKRFVLEGGGVVPPYTKESEIHYARGYHDGQLSKLRALIPALCDCCKERIQTGLQNPAPPQNT